MRLIKEFAVAAVLTAASVYSLASGHAGQATVGTLTIENAWSRQSPMAANVAAGFMKIVNTGSEDDRLVKATAEISGTVQLHDMKMDGDVMKMAEMPDGVVIPAGQTVEFKPGSLHLMFLGLTSQPKEGDTFKGSLTFEKAGTVDVEFEVEAADAGMN